MNLKILFILLVYYSVISLTFLLSGSVFTDAGFNNTVDINSTGLTSEETEQGGFFTVGVSIRRFFGFVAFGIGLASDTPVWFSTLFIIWQTLMTVMAIGFVISSIWNG